MLKLFEPLRIRSVELKNRIAVSPMCQYSSVDGFANDWHLVHLGSRAAGGAGLVICEATAVSAAGRITHQDLGIYKEEHVEFLERINHFIKRCGAVPGIQLAHAGRKASHHRPWEGNAALTADEDPWITQAPSAIAYKDGEPPPHALSMEEINGIIDEFRTAAVRARAAGFEVLELHGAHGYLLHEFLSPLSNHRQDVYGGSFDNRVRFVLNIVDAVRAVWEESLPLFVRLSATDWVEGGWNIEDSIALSKRLKEKGVDLIDCSSGGNSPAQKIPVGPLYQVPFAQRIRQETNVMTGAVGLINTSAEAASIIEGEQADLVLMARQLLRDPYFPLHAARELGVDVAWLPQYERAKKV